MPPTYHSAHPQHSLAGVSGNLKRPAQSASRPVAAPISSRALQTHASHISARAENITTLSWPAVIRLLRHANACTTCTHFS